MIYIFIPGSNIYLRRIGLFGERLNIAQKASFVDTQQILAEAQIVRDLAARLLLDALFIYANSPKDSAEWQEVYEWFMSDDESELTTFRNTCLILDLSPSVVRSRLDSVRLGDEDMHGEQS